MMGSFAVKQKRQFDCHYVGQQGDKHGVVLKDSQCNVCSHFPTFCWMFMDSVVGIADIKTAG